MEKKIGYVYKITSPTGRIYVGSTASLKVRLRYYNSRSAEGQPKLYNSLKKYGFKNHKFDIIEECDPSDRLIREAYWGNKLNVLHRDNLNCILPRSDEKASCMSEETKKKISDTKRKNPTVFSQEYKDNVSRKHRGKIVSEETRKRMRKNNARATSRLVLNMETGIYYDTAKEAAISIGKPISTITKRLHGRMKNNTNLLYV